MDIIMKNTKNIIGIIIAALLIAGGTAGAVYAVVADNKEALVVDGSVTTEKQHDDVEYVYDENGDLRSEIYYKDNVYDGRKDYYNADGDEYVTVFDKDDNEIFSSKAEYNAADRLSKVTSYENHALKETVEYTYADDLRTLTKKTVKTYVGEDEYAEKTYYNEEGKAAKVIKYFNGELTEEIVYDEDYVG